MPLLQIAGALLGVSRVPADRDAVAVAFGIAVRHHRTDRNWSEDGLAYRAGLSREHIESIEAGEGVPTLALTFKLAAGLELPAPDLVRTVEELMK
jgi:transcriptional regulator with XRE-family HTH domain